MVNSNNWSVVTDCWGTLLPAFCLALTVNGQFIVMSLLGKKWCYKNETWMSCCISHYAVTWYICIYIYNRTVALQDFMDHWICMFYCQKLSYTCTVCSLCTVYERALLLLWQWSYRSGNWSACGMTIVGVIGLLQNNSRSNVMNIN